MSKWFLFTRFLFRAVVLYVSMKVYVSITQTSWPSAIMAGKTAISGWPDVHIIRKLHLIYNLSMRFFWTDLKPIFFPPDTNRCYIMILVCVSLSLICISLSTSIYPSTHPSTHPTIHPHHQHRDMLNTKYPLLLLFKLCACTTKISSNLRFCSHIIFFLRVLARDAPFSLRTFF